MSTSHPHILVTGAGGQLGSLVIDHLLAAGSGATIMALVRDKGVAAGLASRGVAARIGDYADSASLVAALAGVDRLLLISSNALGQRVEQHRNVIEAAKRAGVELLVYTSVLHADTSLLGLAEEHRRTEALIQGSGVPFAMLRNGWYTENYTRAMAPTLAHGALFGSAGDGRISSAACADYAAAAAAVLTSDADQSGHVYELAGDESYDLTQFAAEIARQSGKPVVYKNLPEADYKAALLGAGLPEPVAALVSDSDAAAAGGALFDDSGTLGRLIGRPTTPFAATIAAALAAMG